MRAPFLLLILLSMPFVAASIEDTYSSRFSTFMVVVSQNATLSVAGQDARVEFVRAFLDFFPMNDSRQVVVSRLTLPRAVPENSSLVYEWSKPVIGKLTMYLQSEVTIENKFFPVSDKVDFPIVSIPKAFAVYALPSSSIDSDDIEIRTLAMNLSFGEDDLFIIVFKMADWVNKNVVYTKTPQTLDAVQKSSWVLKNRIGVCDELTSLFMALLRSQGIPAKYVSGYAYGFDGTARMGPHSWAEVYFPGAGWVPFDVTYGEYGYIDASHIKLRESADSDIATSRFEWRSHNVNIENSPIVLDVEHLSSKGAADTIVDALASPYSADMTFGSYNYVEVLLMNKNPFYVAEELRLNLPPELSSSDAVKGVLLKPFEKKSVFFLVQMNDVARSFEYSMPFRVSYGINQSVVGIISGASNSPSFSRQFIEKEILSRTEASRKPFVFSCYPDKPFFYSYELVSLSCFVKNDRQMRTVTVCLHDNCKTRDMSPDEGKRFDFVGNSSLGERSYTFTARGSGFSLNTTAIVKVIPVANLIITKINFPRWVSQDFDLTFTLYKSTLDNPLNVSLDISGQSPISRLFVGDMESSKEAVFPIPLSSLSVGKNIISIVVNYYDARGRSYHTEEKIELQKGKPPFWAGLLSWFSGLFLI